MVSLRLLFSSFPQPPRQIRKPVSSKAAFRAAMAAAAAAVGVGMGLAVSTKMANPAGRFVNSSSPIWASLSLSDGASGTSVEPKTGVEFPNVVDGTRRLLGVGLRKKNLFGLKNIDVYAFGVYADDDDVKGLKEKYGTLTMSQLKESKEFHADVLEQDLRMTVRLQIVYSRLSIRSVRSAFEESVGSRLRKYSGSDNKELLQRFTSLFRDEYKIPRGSTIDLSRERGYVLQTRRYVLNPRYQYSDNVHNDGEVRACTLDVIRRLSRTVDERIEAEREMEPYRLRLDTYGGREMQDAIMRLSPVDGKEVGSIQSKLLCQSILDLYIGDDPFDRCAKVEIESGLASLLQN